MNQIDIEVYEDRHNSKYMDHPIKVIERIGSYIYFETKFGLCRKKPEKFGTRNFNIYSAVNKTDYFKAQLKIMYKDEFDLSLINYKTAKVHVFLICRIHGKFKCTPNRALNGNLNCKKCSNIKMSIEYTSNKEEFVAKADLKYNFKYNYSLVKYVIGKEKVIIICDTHGKFNKSPNAHLRNEGCPVCGRAKSTEAARLNPSGWSCTNWRSAAKKSKWFDSFKVYVIRCFNDNEEFYKIGRTFSTINRRFRSKLCMPYSYEVVKVHEGGVRYIYNLENKLQKENKENKYIPKIYFKGREECFKTINNLK